MSKITIDRAVLEQALAEMERHQIFKRFVESIAALREALAQQPPPPPPECKTEAERTAYAFGWYKALETVRQKKEVK